MFARYCLFPVAMLAIAVSFAAFSEDQALTLYVSPHGNDAWSGTLAEPNAGKTDGPCATIAGARDVLRRMRTSGDVAGPVRVLVREGVYFIAEPILFGPEDSGTPGALVAYEAYPGEAPILHGGRRIGGWRQEGDFWVADVPEARERADRIGALWVNGERRTPARTPNAHHPAGDYPTDEEFLYMDGPVMEKDPGGGPDGKSAVRFRYRPGDVQRWPSLEDAVFVVFHSWETSLHRVKELDEADRILTFTGPARWHFGYWRGDQWYFIEHLFEALDQPGEWFLNCREGKLYYIPMPGEDMQAADAVFPVAQQLIRLDGQPAEGRFVEHLHFRGLRLHYADYPIGLEGHSDSQAAWSVSAAFEATGARQCVIEDCVIGHVGGYGVWFRKGSRDNLLTRTEIFDLGAGGVRIGETGDPATEQEAALRNTVDNCFIHDGGRIYRGAVGVWIGRSSHNRISHNEICDFRYTGVSVGWSWGYAPSSAHHNIIEYNRIHNVGKGQLSDMGGIYTLGDSPGTVLRNNYIHDIISNPKISGGWGLYTDEGSTGILMENNIVFNTQTGTTHQHYGKENIYRNNILAFSHREQLIRSREEDHISFTFDRNIIYYNNGRLLGGTWRNGHWRSDNNLFWDASGEELEFAGRSWEQWQAQGFDKHSIVADPLFENIEARDFRIKPDSPAFRIGFKPIDVDKIGLYGDPEWVEKPRRVERYVHPLPQPPATRRIAQDFEAVSPGLTAPDAETLGEEADARIRVSDEHAKSGRHSLKFTDASGLVHVFYPYLVYAPGLRHGTATASFSIRLENGAVFYHEWRDSHSPYHAGPSLWLNADGTIRSGGKVLGNWPADTWIDVTITCPLGRAANGSWSLSITMPGEAPVHCLDLPCNPRFRTLDWFGFVSNADHAVVVYVDDIKLDVK